MASLDRKIGHHLVLTLGFSRRNAEIAIQMFRAGELTRPEEEVIHRIALNPDNDRLSRLYIDSNPRQWVADHLNYRITQAGGDRVSKSSRANASYSYHSGAAIFHGGRALRSLRNTARR